MTVNLAQILVIVGARRKKLFFLFYDVEHYPIYGKSRIFYERENVICSNFQTFPPKQCKNFSNLLHTRWRAKLFHIQYWKGKRAKRFASRYSLLRSWLHCCRKIKEKKQICLSKSVNVTWKWKQRKLNHRKNISIASDESTRNQSDKQEKTSGVVNKRFNFLRVINQFYILRHSSGHEISSLSFESFNFFSPSPRISHFHTLWHRINLCHFVRQTITKAFTRK